MTTVQLQKRKVVGELTVVTAAIQEFMKGLLEEESVHIYYDLEDEEVVVEMGDKAVPLRMMSAGYRSIIGMVADIAYRMALPNPQLKELAAKQTPGVILVDELDLHLHPQWQWRIVEDLKRTFPHVQFIATTHAPNVISSCEEGENIRLNQDDEELIHLKVENAPFGWNIEDVLTEIMNNHSREPRVTEDIQQVEDLYAKSLREEI